VNVLLPDDYYSTSWRRYPVMYLFHGGLGDFRSFDMNDDIRGLTAGQAPDRGNADGGKAGWYSNPVLSLAGPRNWESFHINQLIPWIDANFRTYAEYNGRAVSGFSMGGFGALKYAAKYYGHFASVSSHSGPASLRRDGGWWSTGPTPARLQWSWPEARSMALRSGTRPGSPPTTRANGYRATTTSGCSWSAGSVRT
jgi:S-formylglutathione hydrolase FrmB